MANFILNKYNSMPEQVEENRLNIKELINIIKESFTTNNISLNNTDTTILISDTNAPIDTIDGWLFDNVGKLFKITGGDGTNLLLKFYSDFRGLTGVSIASITLESSVANVDTYKILFTDGSYTTFNVTNGIDGATLEIDDNGIYINKVWSSDKVNNELSNLLSNIKNNAELIWQNATPNSAMSATTLSNLPDITQYKYLLIFAKITEDSYQGIQCFKVKASLINNTFYIDFIAGENNANAVKRMFTINSATEIAVGNGYFGTTSAGYACIPVAIYGTNID